MNAHKARVPAGASIPVYPVIEYIREHTTMGRRPWWEVKLEDCPPLTLPMRQVMSCRRFRLRCMEKLIVYFNLVDHGTWRRMISVGLERGRRLDAENAA